MSYEYEDTPFDIDFIEELEDVPLGEAEGSLGTKEIASLVTRTVTMLLAIIGSVWLVVIIRARKRGSWLEALAVVSVHVAWQVLSWYKSHIDVHWVYLLTSGTVDSQTSKVVFIYFENLLEALAMYSGVVMVGRLAGLVGPLLYILCGVGVLVPLVYSVTILLLDLYISPTNRYLYSTLIGVASFKVIILSLIPLGLLLSWIINHCRHQTKHKRTSTREVASNIICSVLVVFHLVKIAQFIVYILLKTTDSVEDLLVLADVSLGLLETSYFLACLALPWAWILGLLIPVHESNSHDVDMNLKLAKQNKQRNIIKYDKSKMQMSAVSTPPTSPQKFSPEVTSSPSIHSMSSLSRPVSNPEPSMNPDVVPDNAPKKEKRRSYLEAVSNNSLHVLEDAPPRHSKSADPLWLPTGKPIEL